MDKYLAYFRNHEEWNLQRNFLNEVVLLDDKQGDVAYLESHYRTRKSDVINNNRLMNPLLKYVGIETNRRLKKLKQYCYEMAIGRNS